MRLYLRNSGASVIGVGLVDVKGSTAELDKLSAVAQTFKFDSWKKARTGTVQAQRLTGRPSRTAGLAGLSVRPPA
jgi:hypothetical protein